MLGKKKSLRSRGKKRHVKKKLIGGVGHPRSIESNVVRGGGVKVFGRRKIQWEPKKVISRFKKSNQQEKSGRS